MLLREGGGSQGAGMCPELRPCSWAADPWQAEPRRPQLCPPGFLLSWEVSPRRASPPSMGFLSAPRPLPSSNPHPSPTAPNPGCPQPHGHWLQHSQPQSPSPASQPAHSPTPHAPGAPGTPDSPETAQEQPVPTVHPHLPSTGTPVALPLHCVPVQMY